MTINEVNAMRENINVVEFTASLKFAFNVKGVLRDNLWMQASNAIKAKMAVDGYLPRRWWYAILSNPHFKGKFYKYWAEESSHPCGRAPEKVLISTVKIINLGGHYIMISHEWDGVIPGDDKALLHVENCYQFWELKSPKIKDSNFLLSKTGGRFLDC